MLQTADLQESTQALKGKLVSLYEYFIDHQDGEHAGKIKELAKKLESQEFVIAFCGHFSAGKSTMINRLIGENLLPSSPIPTSANLVKVRAGEEYAKVFFKNAKPRLYLAPYDYEIVKSYCKDGDQIEEIEISHSDSQLPKNTIIMDTPGIDSADDAHRIATESALHLADLVFYVMDYNHVQSELNFLFTKELTEAGKEVYLVINQIDKHSNEELSFEAFQTSVKESFASWGVKPAAIFYTSLKMQNHPFNQFRQLKELINERLTGKDQLLIPSIFQSIRKITRDHLDSVRKTTDRKLAPFQEILTELTPDEQENLPATYKNIRMELENIRSSERQTEKEFDQEVSQIMENAYLMPFQTRELAASYLESCQPEFKVGFLFTKQKTAEERQARLEKFYQDILEKTKSQLEWHLREYLLQVLKEQRLVDQELQAKVQELQVFFPSELLAKVVKPGARLSGDYVLTYTEEVAGEIKRIANREVSQLKLGILEALRERNELAREKLESKYKRMESFLNAYEALNKSKAGLESVQREIEALLSQTITDVPDRYQLFAQKEEEYDVIHNSGETSAARQPKRSERKEISRRAIQSAVSYDAASRLQSTADRMKRAAGLIQTLPGFAKLAKELGEKSERLGNKGFTVALFGAFSAGKSSFANALIGKKVLPVSPNPTTAAINKIKPVTDSFRHGTVLVKLKDAAAMLDDVNRALKVFGLSAKSLETALKQCGKISRKKQEGALEKINYNFLQAFTRGYALFAGRLGTVVETTLEEFSTYVALEEKSCFVEWIDLYYDCPLTRKGITIVDTPGADSINARHTGVAFDYIKNSDAILFVTYYNHAFSRADREFLIQLGRVKDSFQLDKMFFIINAIDLAEDLEEKEMVIHYVSSQLVKFGIRNPNLFALSSLQALKEKQQEGPLESGMQPFETAFYQFISNDLTEMAVTAAEKELTRVEEMVEKLIHNAEEDQSIREQKRAHFEKEQADIMGLLASQSPDNLHKRLSQEIEELIYYIKQRVFFRFSDFFKESFNPAVLKSGVNIKNALHQALEELLEAIGFDFAQEMRATTVRIDRVLQKLFAESQAGLMEKLQEINQDLSFPEFELRKVPEIEFQTAFTELDRQLFSRVLAYFKNPKSFFERNEKKLMADEIEKVLNTPADGYLQHEQNRLMDHYADFIRLEFARLTEEMSEQTADFYFSTVSALDGGISVEELKVIREQLKA